MKEPLYVIDTYPRKDFLLSSIFKDLITAIEWSEFVNLPVKSHLLTGFKGQGCHSFFSDNQLVTPTSYKQSGEIFDFLSVENGYLIPDLLLRNGFKSIYTAKNLNPEYNKTIYLNGPNKFTYFVILIFFQMGFNHFKIFNSQKIEDIEFNLNKIQNIFLGIDLSFVDLQDMVMLKPDGEVFVSTCAIQNDQAELINNISYFNFLKQNAFVVDLFSESNPWMSEEARATSLTYVPTQTVYALAEWEMARRFNISTQKMHLKEYLQCL